MLPWFTSEKFFSSGILAAVDVERIARDLDFQVLQDNIEQIALCNIDAEVVSWGIWWEFYWRGFLQGLSSDGSELYQAL